MYLINVPNTGGFITLLYKEDFPLQLISKRHEFYVTIKQHPVSDVLLISFLTLLGL